MMHILHTPAKQCESLPHTPSACTPPQEPDDAAQASLRQLQAPLRAGEDMEGRQYSAFTGEGEEGTPAFI